MEFPLRETWASLGKGLAPPGREADTTEIDGTIDQGVRLRIARDILAVQGFDELSIAPPPPPFPLYPFPVRGGFFCEA